MVKLSEAAMTNSGRHISLLTSQTIALVLAGGRGSRLKALTDWRAKPAVPFAGKFRIIDFPLSNCINAGIRRISVLYPRTSPTSLATPPCNVAGAPCPVSSESS